MTTLRDKATLEAIETVIDSWPLSYRARRVIHEAFLDGTLKRLDTHHILDGGILFWLRRPGCGTLTARAIMAAAKVAQEIDDHPP